MPEQLQQGTPPFYRIFFNKLCVIMSGYGGYSFYSVDSYLHQHMDFYELLIFTGGTFMSYYNGATAEVGRCELQFFKPGTIHRVYCQPLQATHFVICVRKDFFENFVQQHFPGVDLEEIPEFVQKTLPEYAVSNIEALGHSLCETSQQMHLADSIVYNMLLHLFFTVDASAGNTPHYDYVDDIISILNNPVYLDMTVEELCRRYPVSRPTLLKNFKQQTGYSIVEYKTHRRLLWAARLLEDPTLKLSVTDVCVNLGYDSMSYFLRAFKKKFGVTPSEYRRRHQSVDRTEEA